MEIKINCQKWLQQMKMNYGQVIKSQILSEQYNNQRQMPRSQRKLISCLNGRYCKELLKGNCNYWHPNWQVKLATLPTETVNKSPNLRNASREPARKLRSKQKTSIRNEIIFGSLPEKDARCMAVNKTLAESGFVINKNKRFDTMQAEETVEIMKEVFRMKEERMPHKDRRDTIYRVESKQRGQARRSTLESKNNKIQHKRLEQMVFSKAYVPPKPFGLMRFEKAYIRDRLKEQTKNDSKVQNSSVSQRFEEIILNKQRIERIIEEQKSSILQGSNRQRNKKQQNHQEQVMNGSNNLWQNYEKEIMEETTSLKSYDMSSGHDQQQTIAPKRQTLINKKLSQSSQFSERSQEKQDLLSEEEWEMLDEKLQGKDDKGESLEFGEKQEKQQESALNQGFYKDEEEENHVRLYYCQNQQQQQEEGSGQMSMNQHQQLEGQYQIASNIPQPQPPSIPPTHLPQYSTPYTHLLEQVNRLYTNPLNYLNHMYQLSIQQSDNPLVQAAHSPRMSFREIYEKGQEEGSQGQWGQQGEEREEGYDGEGQEGQEGQEEEWGDEEQWGQDEEGVFDEEMFNWYFEKNYRFSLTQLPQNILTRQDQCIICLNSFLPAPTQKKFNLSNSCRSKDKLIQPNQQQKHQENFVIQLFCNHTFHEECILNWLTMNPACPICRKDFRSHPQYDQWDQAYEEVLQPQKAA